jgi:tryptophan 2-C-methyltransferase
MLTLINTNLMKPPIAPIGLDYIAGAAQNAGINTDILDLCRHDEPDKAIENYFSRNSSSLVGLSFRNVDDCFWPSAQWFVPQLKDVVKTIKKLTDSPLVIGGVGFSIFPQQIIEYTDADFGVHGDGEQAIVDLYHQLKTTKKFDKISGLVWRDNGKIVANKPAWQKKLSLETSRNAIDNKWYFSNGGQAGIETKRGCPGNCIYCADPLAKGAASRTREPSEVADEIENLLSQGIDCLHICDPEFNIPYRHAEAVCEEIVRRNLGQKIRWYAYLSITPFDAPLAAVMKKAGCAGIDFTTDSASETMLKTYRQPYARNDIEKAVQLCRQHSITVMLDLLLGGPGETPQTAEDSISFFKTINPDCIGAPVGVRIYPATVMADLVCSEGPLEANPNIKRKYEGPVDFFKPTFYISSLLGGNPARLVRDLIAGDKRFFAPALDDGLPAPPTDHNYNDNTELTDAIAQGARGAYWDILCRLRSG